MDAKYFADLCQKVVVDPAKKVLSAAEIKCLEAITVHWEAFCPGVPMANALPVPLIPVRTANSRVLDSLIELAFDFHGDGEPDGSAGRLDQVAIAPVSSCVLHVVIQDELVNEVDEVEVALPGDVV